jgi:hypothetical protein
VSRPATGASATWTAWSGLSRRRGSLFDG